MKMENALPAPVAGTIKAINCKSGDSVAKNAVLAIIG
jgi:oxaloacetate decarboxylase alpha subunit/pyruvate carboxylase subunit B